MSAMATKNHTMNADDAVDDDDKDKKAQTGIDTRAVLQSAAAWASLFAGTTLIFRHAKWLRLHSGKRLPIEAASRVVGAAHAAWSTAAAFSQCPELVRIDAPQKYMLSCGRRPTLPHERKILERSMGYFVWDSIYLLLWERDPLFIVHHLSCLTNWGTCLAHGRGERVMWACMGYGEISGPLLNLWWLAKKSQRPALARVLSRLFTLVFLFFRLGVFPPFCLRYVQSVLRGEMGRMVRSERLARLWAVVNVAAVLGGVVWSKSLIKGFLADVKRSH